MNSSIHDEQVLRLQKALLNSESAKMLAFRKVITNKGKRTPGPDGKVFTQRDLGKVMNILSNKRNYRCGGVKRV